MYTEPGFEPSTKPSLCGPVSSAVKLEVVVCGLVGGVLVPHQPGRVLLDQLRHTGTGQVRSANRTGQVRSADRTGQVTGDGEVTDSVTFTGDKTGIQKSAGR